MRPVRERPARTCAGRSLVDQIEALRAAGATEIVVEGDRVTGRWHQPGRIGPPPRDTFGPLPRRPEVTQAAIARLARAIRDRAAGKVLVLGQGES